ncbi:hypothetical protein [Halocella sp. SP3-1]|uniref:hypothetical protein n=1 Tax=Halocella sp. SP3-1 TaxID=2382161 RepID=UPI000F751C7B|nr:hypothetical protein [Halocella sp. SP3-1]AZO94968.1 hypothetical protein D7D81_10410 [Halocella sp. SP3-1]
MLKNNCPVQFGYSDVDITPDWPVELVGFDRVDNTSKGVWHKLKAQVLIGKSAKEKCCLITIDSLGFTVALTNKLRDLIANEIGQLREKVMVCFSHTHSAPNAGIDERYYTFVCKQVLSAVKKAQSTTSTLKVGWGVAEGDIGLNRRGQQSIVDKRLGVLKFSDNADIPKLLLLRVSAHANVLCSDNYKISADYFATTRDLLEARYGCKVMMIQGAAGDIRPKYQQENAEYLEVHGFEASMKSYSVEEKQKYFQQSIAALDQMAQSIYYSVDSIWKQVHPVSLYRLAMFSESHVFKADVPTKEKAIAIANEAQKKAGIDGTSWLFEVDRLNRQNVHIQKADIEIQYFVLNDGCLCGIANEVMCQIALDIEKRAKTPLLFFSGYVNGTSSYLPTAQEYDKGGYEVLWSNLIYYQYHGRVMPLNRETAKSISEIVANTWSSFLENGILI